MKFINKFDLKSCTKSIVIFNDSDNATFKEIDSVLNNSLSKIKGFEKVNTLGNFKFQNIYLVSKGFGKKIAGIKEDVVVLFDTFQSDVIIENLTESIITNSYEFTKYKKAKREQKNVEIFSTKDLTSNFNKGVILGESINSTKDLVNTPYCDMSAHDLAEYATNLGKSHNIDVKIFDKPEIEKMGMHSFLSVGAGSLLPPKLITMKYQGKSKWENPIALVGKGVMFDTGGYSLKVGGTMANMKTDMGGSAVVMGAIEAISRLGLKENVLVVVAATDNAINEKATYPDDIVKSMKGLTIEVNNTDAEGRLTLCDALTYAQQEGAKRVIDIATLTGGIITALGNDITGAFTNSKSLLNIVQEAADTSSELIWELPVESFRKAVRNKSKLADLHNSPGRPGQSSLAAAFLREFIEEGTEWVHLDIAGVASKDGLATGKMVKTLVNTIK